MNIRHERDGFVLTDDDADLDLELIHEWLSTKAYWALGRPREVVERSLEHSRVFSIVRDEELVGIGRVVTDNATFAWICDVFIDESVRGLGLGHWLIDTIVDELSLEGVPRFLLATRDAHQVYADSGFVPLEYPERWMEIDRRANRHSLATQEV